MILWFLIVATAGQISPEPLSINVDSEKQIDVPAGTYVVFADEAAATDAGWFDQLQAAVPGGLRRTTASRYRENDFAFYVGVARDHPSFRERRQRRWLDNVPEVGPQGYRLLIDRRGVVIAGTDEAGVIHGITTLLQLFNDGSLPETLIRDEPEITLRAIRLRELPDAGKIHALARAKCNFAIIETADWWALKGPAAERWRTAFAALRAAGIEPVPAIAPLSDTKPLLTIAPLAAHAQIGIDQFILTNDTWTALTHPNVIDTPSSPVRVRSGGIYFESGRDYILAPSQTAAPFGNDGSHWQIRRIADGAIPENESVDVLYSYIAPGTLRVNPLTPEYQTAIRDTVRSMVDVLQPRYLHIGHANRASLVSQQGDPDPFVASLTAIVDAVAETGAELRLIAYADAFRSRRPNLLPDDTLFEVRPAYGPPTIGPTPSLDLAWARTLGRTLLLSAPAAPLDALTSCETAARTRSITGIITDDIDVARIAWSPARRILPWPRVLNEYFGTRLWNPGSIEVFEALAARANEQTARGVAPETELNAFRRWFEYNRERIPAEDATFVEGHYTRILEWVRLEAEYRRGDGRNTMRDLLDLVQRHATATPDYPENRRSTIVHTIDSAGRFVPSTILFGTPVLPYRAINLPGSHTLIEVPVRPEFTDRQGATEARFDLLESPGPIVRIDFDTLNPSSISVDRSTDGKTFENVQRWRNSRTNPSGPPLLIQHPFSAATFSITIEGNPPVLRDPRVFALKDVPAAICSRTATAPVLDGSFRESCWPKEAQVNGFIETTQHRFATAATTVRLTYTRNALYLGVYAREPRMDTLVAEIANRDGPLWTEEAIDIRIGIGNDEFIFATSPNAVQFDSKNGNAQWNGTWTVRTRRYATGWTAEIKLPFKTLGKRPHPGEDWQFDAVRYRRNVEQSTSHWAYRPDAAKTRAPGRLIFN